MQQITQADDIYEIHFCVSAKILYLQRSSAYKLYNLAFPHCDKVFIVKTSLQCYSVLSTIAQVLRKMSLKILASLFLCLIYHRPLNQTRGLKYIHTYSVNDLGLKNSLQ